MKKQIDYQMQIDRIIAKAWLNEQFKEKLLKDPKTTLLEEGVTLSPNFNPQEFIIPNKPDFKFGEEISRNTMDASNTHMNCSYCYCG